MATDLALTAGVTLLALGLVSLLDGYSRSQFPRLGVVMGLAGGALVGWVATTQPDGLVPRDIPEAFVRVLAMILN